MTEGGIELLARRVMVAAYLYYVLDAPTISDATYDTLSRCVADKWDKLEPLRQWCLGSPDQIRASGHHIKFTAAAVYGALAEHIRNGGDARDKIPRTWQWCAEHQVHYVTAMA